MIGRTITAAATRFARKLGSRNNQDGNTNGGWQNEAWDLYSQIPEIRFVSNWIGDAAGGARLYAGRRLEDGTIEEAPDNHPAAQIVADIAGGPDGQSQLLNEASLHLVVPGEFWLIIRTTEDGTPEWHTLSTSEVTQTRDGLTVEIEGEKTDIPAYDPAAPAGPDVPVAIRVWQPYPRRHIEADSPVRSSLVVLEELRLLNAAVAAIARSRITGRGVLMVPKGTRFPTAPGQGDAEDDLIEVFMEVASTAIREPESAAATVPIILEIPADLVGKVEWLTFESGFDELALKLREEAIRRFATGMEIPAELLLGLDSMNHWGATLVGAEGIRLGVEPKLRLICHALTSQWLQPLLEADNVPDADEWVVWHDTSKIRVQANRGQTALEAYQLGLISGRAARREVGFDETDAPTGTPDDTPAPSTPDDEEPNTVTTLPVAENPGLPNTLPAAAQPAAGDALVAAVDGIIWAALSGAGTRLLTKPACPRSERARARELVAAEVHVSFPVDVENIDGYRLLDGAWARVPEVAARYGLDVECITYALDDYCRALIAARTPHSFEDVPRLLRMSGCTQEAAA